MRNPLSASLAQTVFLLLPLKRLVIIHADPGISVALAIELAAHYPRDSDHKDLEMSAVSSRIRGQHNRVRNALGLPKDFVLHSLRHTFLTRLGEAGVDAFTIMRIAGHSTITVSQKYVHPSSEAGQGCAGVVEWQTQRT